MREFEGSISSVSDVYERTSILALLNYNLRKLQLLAKGDLYSPPAEEIDLRTNVIFLYK